MKREYIGWLEEKKEEEALALKAVEGKEWPELIGSEKQVEWATKIRAKAATSNSGEYTFIYKDKVYMVTGKAMNEVMEAVIIPEKINATFWIDNRYTDDIKAVKKNALEELAVKNKDMFDAVLKSAKEMGLEYALVLSGLRSMYRNITIASLKLTDVNGSSVLGRDGNYCTGEPIKLIRKSNGEITATGRYDIVTEQAETIKADTVKKSEGESEEDIYIKIAASLLKKEAIVCFMWYEQNEEGKGKRDKKREEELRDKALRLASSDISEEVETEVIVIPENRVGDRVVEIYVGTDSEIFIPVIDEPEFRSIASGLGFIWSPGYFSKEISLRTGKVSDLIAEAGAEYLKNGYAVQFPDSKSKQKAENGDFEKDILNSVKYSTQLDKLLIYTRFYEDCDAAWLKRICRKTRGSEYHWSRVAVPLSAADLVLDYAKEYSYTVCNSAKEAIAKEKAYVASDLFEEKYEQHTIPKTLIDKYPELAKNVRFVGGEEADEEGFISVYIDKNFDSDKISLSYELVEMKYKDYIQWNKSHELSETLILDSYDEETKLAEVYVPDKCKDELVQDPEDLKKYGARNERLHAVRTGWVTEAVLSTPEVINAEELNVEVPECLQN